jgi:hypothetical protein
VPVSPTRPLLQKPLRLPALPLLQALSFLLATSHQSTPIQLNTSRRHNSPDSSSSKHAPHKATKQPLTSKPFSPFFPSHSHNGIRLTKARSVQAEVQALRKRERRRARAPAARSAAATATLCSIWRPGTRRRCALGLNRIAVASFSLALRIWGFPCSFLMLFSPSTSCWL